MKKFTLLTGFLLICTIANAQNSYYYYYKGERKYLTLNTKYAFLSVKEQQLPNSIRQRNLRATSFRSDNIETKSNQKQKQANNVANRYYKQF